MLLLLLAAVCLGSALYLFSELVTAPARERRNLVTRAADYGRLRVSHGRELPQFRERVIAPFVRRASALMLRVNPRANLDSVAAKLMAAGMRKTSPAGFLATKAALTVGGLLFGLLLVSSHPSPGGLALLVGFGAAGYILPGVLVSGRAARRVERVAADLPDAL